MKKRVSILLPLLLAFAMLVGLIAGCTNSQTASTPTASTAASAANSTAQPKASTPASVASPTVQPAANGKQTITDMNGRKVEIPANPTRIATAFPYVTYAALALGKTNSLVAVDSASTSNASLIGIFPTVKNIAGIGSAFNINNESLLLANPEMVVTVTWAKDPDKVQSTTGIPVVCVDMNLYKESLEFLGKLLGAQDKAKEFITYYEQKVSYIAGKIADVPKEKRTKVYIAGGNGRLSTFGKESTWHYEITDAGGINVAADITGGGSQDVSMEQVLAWDPDVIILDNSCKDSVADILSDAKWAPVSAVKNKRVFKAPSGYLDTWGRPQLESALARVWQADKLYPGKLGLDITQEAKTFFSKFYGVNLTDDQVNKILNPS